MPDVFETACKWLEEGRDVALATVVQTWKSAPIGVGGQLVVDSEAHFEGSVSGGCVEAEVIARSADVISSGLPQMLEFGVADETAWNVGLPCGGNICVMLNRLTGPATFSALGIVQRAREDREPIVVKTRLSDGTITPIRQAEALRCGGNVANVLKSGISALVETPEGKAFLHAFLPSPRIIIAGATHIAQILVRLAIDVGFDTVIIDPREAFASETRFGGTRLLTGWPADALQILSLDSRTAVVTLAHHADIDDQTLVAALRGPAFYVGSLGSRRTHAKRIERLKGQGLGMADIGRIHAPVGLDIGANTPGEIALSILAQIVAAFRMDANAGR